jgi:hypothetical protein
MAISRPVLSLYMAMACVAAAFGADAQQAAIPSSAEIKKVVSRHFAAKEDFQPGDLIIREDVKPLLEKLRKLGLPLPDAKKILDDAPRGDEFIAQQLATPDGQKFMRRISKYPMAYDRLDRLGRLPRGRSIVRELIRGPGGEKMIEYMTTAAGGKELGKMLSNSPGASDFNAPTGRIYTVEMLLERLEESRQASIKAAQDAAKKPRP